MKALDHLAASSIRNSQAATRAATMRASQQPSWPKVDLALLYACVSCVSGALWGAVYSVRCTVYSVRWKVTLVPEPGSRVLGCSLC